MRRFALVLSGASGMELAVRFAQSVLSNSEATLHVVATSSATKVLVHELGNEFSSARAFCERVAGEGQEQRLVPWKSSEMISPIASGSYRLDGVVVLPCSAGMVGSLANGISRGLGQRVADVALKQRWPLVVGVRETPMSVILLENLRRLAVAGAHIVPPLPAFYLKPSPDEALATYMDHYCVRVLDLLGIEVQADHLRWSG